MASKKKRRASDFIVLGLLALIAYGAYVPDWRPILAGVGGLSLMLSAWMAFRLSTQCDVKNKRSPGYCSRPLNGLLFGCGDHHWDKVLAWSRYFGTGYLARWLHIRNFPVLRFQAAHVRQSEPVLAAAGARLASEPEHDSDSVTVTDRRNVALFYFTAVSCIATVVGTVASVIGVVVAVGR